MPYLDLQAPGDFVSIFYRTNSHFGNVGSFDKSKPTIVILHPYFLDSTWLDLQFGDYRLDSTYNIIAFDTRSCGRSVSRPSGLHDSWVEAADLAQAFHALHLPPCHILALESSAVNCALRFAALFGDLCLSLALCNVPPPTELKWVFTAYDEILRSWCYAEDLDSFEHALGETLAFVVGRDCDPDLQDELVAFWEEKMPPFRRQRVVECVNVLMNRVPLKPNVLACITQPVLILQGDQCETCPMKYAEKLAADLVNAEGGAILYKVRGGNGYLSIIPTNASIANQTYAKFLARLPKARSDIRPPLLTCEEHMSEALGTLAELMVDPTILKKDCRSSLSFSCVAPDVLSTQNQNLRDFGKDQSTAFSPLRRDGRPIRKFSERKGGHWFQGERDGLSYASNKKIQTKVDTQIFELEREWERDRLPIPTSEPITVQDTRMRRTTSVNANSVEKHVVKGSVAKVISNATPTPLRSVF